MNSANNDNTVTQPWMYEEHLPEGAVWYGMNGNFKRYEGGQAISVPVTISSIPMFLRGSAICFTSEDIHQASYDVLRSLGFIISAGSGDANALFYDDDGREGRLLGDRGRRASHEAHSPRGQGRRTSRLPSAQ